MTGRSTSTSSHTKMPNDYQALLEKAKIVQEKIAIDNPILTEKHTLPFPLFSYQNKTINW